MLLAFAIAYLTPLTGRPRQLPVQKMNALQRKWVRRTTRILERAALMIRKFQTLPPLCKNNPQKNSAKKVSEGALGWES